MFLPGKEAVLIMIDEFKTHSMSMEIMRHMDQVNNSLLAPNEAMSQFSYLHFTQRQDDDEKFN